MGVKWCDGCWNTGDAADLATEYTFTGSGTIEFVEFDERRTGAGGYDITDVTIAHDEDLTGAAIVLGFAYTHYTESAYNLVQLLEGSTPHLTVRVAADGLLSVYRGDHTGTLLATATGGTELPAWLTVAYIEVTATIHDSTGAVTVAVDGVNLIEQTSINTRNGGTGALDGWSISGSAGGARMGDLYVLDPGDGIAPTAATGETSRVDVKTPIAAASPSEWSTSSGATKPSAVADTGSPDDDSTYVVTSTDGAVDMYRVSAVDHNPETIHAVRVSAWARRVQGAATSLAMRAAWTGVTTQIGDPVELSTSWSRVNEVVSIDEATASAGLSQDEMNTGTYGFQVEV